MLINLDLKICKDMQINKTISIIHIPQKKILI